MRSRRKIAGTRVVRRLITDGWYERHAQSAARARQIGGRGGQACPATRLHCVWRRGGTSISSFAAVSEWQWLKRAGFTLLYCIRLTRGGFHCISRTALSL